MTFFATARAAHDFLRSDRDAENRCKLRVDLLALLNEIFDANNLGFDVHLVWPSPVEEGVSMEQDRSTVNVSNVLPCMSATRYLRQCAFNQFLSIRILSLALGAR